MTGPHGPARTRVDRRAPGGAAPGRAPNPLCSSAALLLLAACADKTPVIDADAPAAEPAVKRCSVEVLADVRVPETYETVGSVGQYTFYAHPRGLACSEPAGLTGDCEFISRERPVLISDGARMLSMLPLRLPTYLVYGPGHLDCVAPPG